MDNEQRIRIATSKPSLKHKVKTQLDGPTDVIYWYIRFNIPLDESSVSEKTMDVTDTEGYIMRTDISYETKKNLIVISPLDTYEQNRFYLLNISKKVRSARGQNLRSSIHVLFKLLENQISDYQILKKTVKVPKPKPRPRDYDRLQSSRKPNSFDAEYMKSAPRDRMAPVSFKIKLWVGLVGLLITLASLMIGNLVVIIIGGAVCLAGFVHVYAQLKKKELRSVLLFNQGVRKFNKENYRDAELSFQKALNANPDNELAKYGLYKSDLFK